MNSTERVIGLCATPPEQRSEEEIQFVAQWIIAKSAYFRKVPYEAICEVVRDCRLQRFRRNELIIRQGEKGHSFYVIIAGGVSVYVNKDLEQDADDGRKEGTDPAPGSAKGDRPTASPDYVDDEKDSTGDGEAAEDSFQVVDEQATETADDNETMRSRVLGTKVLQMGDGYAFGEIALTSLNSIRKASVICDEDSSVLVVHQDSYTKSLRAFQLQEYQQIEGFIDSCPVFAKWRRKHKLTLRNSLRREQYSYGDLIVRQGNDIGGLFFIVRGSVKLLADPSKWPAAVRPKEQGGPSVTAGLQVAAAAATAAASPVLSRRREGYRAAERRHLGRQFEITQLGEGEILGLVELVGGFRQSLFVSVSTEPTFGYLLNHANCKRLFASRKTIEKLRHTNHTRLLSWCRRAPFMRRLIQDPRVVGVGAATTAAAAAAAPPDQEVTGQKQKAQHLHLQATLLHTRKQPPSIDDLWEHMLAMYIEGRSQLGPVPTDPSLFYRHLCRVNAERRQHLRERALPKLQEQAVEAGAESTATPTATPLHQPQRRAVPRSMRQLRRDIEAAGGDWVAGFADHKNSVEDSNRLAFRPAEPRTAPNVDASVTDAQKLQKPTMSKSSSAPGLLVDFELSKMHLSNLEQRIEVFCAPADHDSPEARGGGGYRRGGASRNKPHVVPLLLLSDFEVQKPRIRGSHVLVRHKRCSAAAAASGSTPNGLFDGPVVVIGHSHVTNHLVQSLPEWDLQVMPGRRERLRQLEEQHSAAAAAAAQTKPLDSV